MFKLATYLHPCTCYTSKPMEQIRFIGHSLPHFAQVRSELENALAEYPALPVRQVELDAYRSVHTIEYLDTLARLAAGEAVKAPPKLSIECAGFEHCLPGYQYSLGGMLEAIDRMKAGTLERAYCFSLGGHHAYPDWGHGYCLLNPQAAAAKYAQQQSFERVLIVDWDHHHGDGTQAIFAHDPMVHCISIHSAMDLYMAAMRVLRQGTTTAAERVGHSNIPLLQDVFDDSFFDKMKLEGRFYRAADSLNEFQAALDKIPWKPDIVFIFAGYDSHRDDCGAGVTNWTDEDFARLTRSVLNVAEKATCPVLSVHGGGYKLPVTIPAAIAHVKVLASELG